MLNNTKIFYVYTTAINKINPTIFLAYNTCNRNISADLNAWTEQ